MSFRNCINNAEAEGTITAEQAAEVRDLFDEFDANYKGKMAPGSAEVKAAQDAFAAMQKEVMERKRQKLLQVRNWQQISQNLESYRNLSGQQDFGRAAEALFASDGLARYSNIEFREQAIRNAMTRKLYNVLGNFRRNLIGQTRNKAQQENLVRAAFGEQVEDASAREMGEAWVQTAEYGRKRFNAAGGRIPKLENWGFPQAHNMLKIRKAGYQQWRESIVPKLDVNRIIDQKTGLPFTPESLELALNDVFQTITTDGMNKLKPGAMGQGKSLANQRLDHRFLVFKNADSWLAYQKEFGNPEVFDAMFGHISNMARDIAMMEVLGPNPKATTQFLKQTIQKQAAGDEAAENAARSAAARIDNFYMAVTGKTNSPINSKFGTTFAGLRQLLQSAQLGSASIAAITDLNFGRMARGFVGLPQTKMLKNYFNLISPLSADEKGRLAIRLGLIADGWSTLAAAQMRYVGDMSGPEITRRVSDFVMRASLLSPMTNAGRWAFGMEFLGGLADNVGKRFDELDPNMRTTMERYSISADHWDIIRTTELFDEEGAKFLRAEDIEARTDLAPTVARDLATRVMEMVETETNFAVPSSSLRGRIALTGETRPGTIAGELARSFAMYKNFGVTLINTHVARGMQQPGVKGKGRYYADLLISTTLMGALAMQMKEISKGRDPRPMDSNEFWLAAFLQGGGLGIYGDFAFSDVNRFDRGLAETVAGPVVGFADDLRKLTLGNIVQASQGEDTNAARELIKFAGRYTPGASLWYSRLALERMVLDQMQLYADPKARSNMKRLESKMRREYGQKYWWRPGKTAPSRAPDLSNALEETP